MNKSRNTSNGGVNLLAEAMREVFNESMESVCAAVKDDMAKMETRLLDTIKGYMDATNEDMQAQFAERQKEIAEIGRTLSER